jgi:hypothetical protein
MDLRLVLLVFVSASIGTSQSGAQTTEIAARLTKTALMVVPVALNGRGPYNFVIDTGATTTTLDERLATELGLRASGTVPIVTLAGGFDAPMGRMDSLILGTVRVTSVWVSWMALDSVRDDDRTIRGVLGQDILARHTVTIDYRRSRVRLGTEACTGGDTRVNVGWADRRPMISVRVRAAGLRRDAQLVLDSAANALVLFDEPASSEPATLVRTHAAATSAAIVPGTNLEIGGLQLSGPAVVLPSTVEREESGLLPTTWFSRVCVDGPRRIAVLTR